MQVAAFVLVLENQGLSQRGPTFCSPLNQVPDAFDINNGFQWNTLAQKCLSRHHSHTSVILTHVVPNDIELEAD